MTTMKQSFLSHGLLLLFLLSLCLISSFHSTSATRPLISKQGEEKVIDMGPLVPLEEMEVMDQEFHSTLMGMEHCENGDEECLKRRMTAEAHLDYIYTDHHHHP